MVHRVYLRRTQAWTSELLGDWAFRPCIQCVTTAVSRLCSPRHAHRHLCRSHAEELRTKVKQLRQQLLDVVARCKGASAAHRACTSSITRGEHAALGYTPTAAARRPRSASRKHRPQSGAGAASSAAQRPRARPSTGAAARRKRRATADPLGAALGLSLASAGPSKKRARKAKRKSTK